MKAAAERQNERMYGREINTEETVYFGDSQAGVCGEGF